MASPVFIIGNPRSGTTLLRLMMSAHSQIVVAPECGFIQWWYDKYKNWSINDSSNVHSVKEFIKDIKTSKKIETWNLNFEQVFVSILKAKPINYASLCIILYEEYAKKYNKYNLVYLGDKNNYYLNYLDLLHGLYSNAKYIVIVRDGRDVACSYLSIEKIKAEPKYKPTLPTDILEIAKEWADNNLKIIKFCQFIDRRSCFFTRFEDLVSKSKEELSKICNFLNVDFEDKMLNYYNSQIKEPEETIQWKYKTLFKPDPNNILKYKSILTKEEINTFNSYAIKVLKIFNYE